MCFRLVCSFWLSRINIVDSFSIQIVSDTNVCAHFQLLRFARVSDRHTQTKAFLILSLRIRSSNQHYYYISYINQSLKKQRCQSSLQLHQQLHLWSSVCLFINESVNKALLSNTILSLELTNISTNVYSINQLRLWRNKGILNQPIRKRNWFHFQAT